jgi:hypothetical protein
MIFEQSLLDPDFSQSSEGPFLLTILPLVDDVLPHQYLERHLLSQM